MKIIYHLKIYVGTLFNLECNPSQNVPCSKTIIHAKMGLFYQFRLDWSLLTITPL